MLSASHVNLIGRMVVVSVVNSHHYDAKIVINCVPTYTPDRDRFATRAGVARSTQLL
jgi:hypothetical protein